jgi:nitric oxide reductase NorD protein
MEEQVGAFWHRWVTHTASQRHPEAAVLLEDIQKSLGVIFRALGGDGGLKVEASYATDHFGQRTLLQRIAGSDKRVNNSWRDERALLLPPLVDLFADPGLNRDLYIWLAMLAATPVEAGEQHWIEQNRNNTVQTLQRFPGLRQRYQHLAEAVIALRPPVEKISLSQRITEQAIQEVILHPDSAPPFPLDYKVGHIQPIPLWLVLPPDQLGVQLSQEENGAPPPDSNEKSPTKEPKNKKRRKAERTENPDGKSGLLALRMETIFSWAEYVKVDRTTDDDEDENAEERAEDLDHLSIARDQQTSGPKVKFDLDLPAAEYDDMPLSEGVLYPEWNYKTHQLVKDQCSVIPLLAVRAESCGLPDALRMPARKVRRQFEALIPSRTWFRGEADGAELDLESYIEFAADQLGKYHGEEPSLYRDFRRGNRDLATLLLADLSLSTDSWVNNHSRVVDVIRESLHLFSDALSRTGDRFSLYGFSSLNRDHVRFHQIKTFEEPFSDTIRGRIEAVKPGYYTRMGAAIRHATSLLVKQPASRRILLLLTDGKPNDLDKYEGRYGIEDTREAIFEAKRVGLYPFCVTIDEEGGEYLPHIFGPSGYIVIRKPEELPLRLPRLYAQITQGNG